MLLSSLYPLEKINALVLTSVEWHPFPKGAERAGWTGFNEALRRTNIAKAVKAMKSPWPHLPATLYLEFARAGNRSHYEAPYFRRREILGQMVVGECLEGKGRFLDAIANAAWSICEESSWCIPAHTDLQAAGSGLPDTAEPVVDLFAAETSAQLAWTAYLLGSELAGVSPQMPARIEREIQARVLTPNLARDDFWWMGFGSRSVNNWNPWINSNWLTAILLVERDPQRRAAALHKSLRSLDKFIAPYPADGGCDEGPSYWGRAGASLFDCLELLYSASDGQINVYDQPIIQNMGKFIYRVHIDGGYFVNFADAPARLRPDGSLVIRYGRRIGDPEMISFGAWAARQERLLEKGFGEAGDLGRVLPTLFNLKELAEAAPKAPLVRDTWLDKIQVVTARQRAGSSHGLYLAAKGGHNGESHNHNDVGHFVVYNDGKPLIIDAGVETYSRKTFSPQRYEIWTMQSAYHSLPTIDGVMQAPGAQFKASQVAYTADAHRVKFSLDIAGAYPPEARLNHWLRTITFERAAQYIQVEDHYDLSAPVRELTLSLLTPCKVQFGKPGELFLLAQPLAGGRQSGSGKIAYDSDCLAVTTENIPIEDNQLRQVWGEQLVRILFKSTLKPSLTGGWAIKITPAA